jgi:hypothetical protein
LAIFTISKSDQATYGDRSNIFKRIAKKNLGICEFFSRSKVKGQTTMVANPELTLADWELISEALDAYAESQYDLSLESEEYGSLQAAREQESRSRACYALLEKLAAGFS